MSSVTKMMLVFYEDGERNEYIHKYGVEVRPTTDESFDDRVGYPMIIFYQLVWRQGCWLIIA